jgi:hypothetical protein
MKRTRGLTWAVAYWRLQPTTCVCNEAAWSVSFPASTTWHMAWSAACANFHPTPAPPYMWCYFVCVFKRSLDRV